MQLRERNEKIIKNLLLEGETVKSLRGYFKKKFAGQDCENLIEDEKFFGFSEGGFSWKKLENKLMEADMSGSFVQFLRAGINQIVNGMYESTKTTYEEWVHVIPSKMNTELLPLNQGVAFPSQVGEGQLYPETGVSGLDLSLKNLKYGMMYSLSKELLNDDQSGTFAQQPGLMGEYLKLLSEVLCMGKLASIAGGATYLNYTVPACETQPSDEVTYPYSTALVGGGRNRPDTYVLPTQGNIQNGIIAMMSQKNRQGIKMNVNVDKIILGPKYAFDISVLLNSAFYPSGAATAGAVGGAFAINPMKGILDPIISRFMFKSDGTVNGDSTAWYLNDSKKPGFIQLMREPVQITQENPESGESFNRDLFRFKCSTRMNADYLEVRYFWRGNDGSVTT